MPIDYLSRERPLAVAESTTGELSFRLSADTTTRVAMVAPQNRVAFDARGFTLAVVSRNDEDFESPEAAIEAGLLRVMREPSGEEAELLLQSMVSEEIRRCLIFPLVLHGKRPGTWRLHATGDRLSLEVSGVEHVVYEDPYWWVASDEPRSKEVAALLVRRTGLPSDVADPIWNLTSG
jgi:hypothetical protein